jgi:hypothetical protein
MRSGMLPGSRSMANSGRGEPEMFSKKRMTLNELGGGDAVSGPRRHPLNHKTSKLKKRDGKREKNRTIKIQRRGRPSIKKFFAMSKSAKKRPRAGEHEAKMVFHNGASGSRQRGTDNTTRRNGQASAIKTVAALNGHAVDPTSAAASFLQKLFDGRPIHLCSYANDRSETKKFPPHHDTIRDPADVDVFIEENDITGRATYFAVNVMRGRRRSKEKIAQYNALYTDIDFKGVVEDEKTIRGVLAKLPIKPSAVVSSGHGLHVYWLLGPVIESSDINLEDFEELLRKLAHILAGDESAAEAARVLRLPESHNSKGGEWLDVNVVEELTSWKTYSFDELRAWIESAAPLPPLLNHKQTKADNEIATRQSRGSNPYLDFYNETRAESGGFDAKEWLDKMSYKGGGNGINNTYSHVVGAMVEEERPVEECLRALLGPAKRVFERDCSPSQRWNEKTAVDEIIELHNRYTKKDAKRRKLKPQRRKPTSKRRSPPRKMILMSIHPARKRQPSIPSILSRIFSRPIYQRTRCQS